MNISATHNNTYYLNVSRNGNNITQYNNNNNGSHNLLV